MCRDSGPTTGDDNPTQDELPDDLYAGFDEEAERVARLFASPEFAEREQQRQLNEALTPIKRRSAAGSVGNALALGFANVFDPDRQRDDIVAVQERGDDDGDVPDTQIDPDDPSTTRVVYRPGQLPKANP